MYLEYVLLNRLQKFFFLKQKDKAFVRESDLEQMNLGVFPGSATFQISHSGQII